MAKTLVTAAAQWTGKAFDIGADDIPYWIIQAMGSRSFAITNEEEPDTHVLTVTTPAGPVVANAADWVFLTAPLGVEGEDGFIPAGLGVATAEDFNTNFEIAA